MKKLVLTTVTYTFACLLGLSFYYSIFKLFQFSPALGMALISCFVFGMTAIIKENGLLSPSH